MNTAMAMMLVDVCMHFYGWSVADVCVFMDGGMAAWQQRGFICHQKNIYWQYGKRGATNQQMSFWHQMKSGGSILWRVFSGVENKSTQESVLAKAPKDILMSRNNKKDPDNANPTTPILTAAAPIQTRYSCRC